MRRWFPILFLFVVAIPTRAGERTPEKVVALAFVNPCGSYANFVGPLLKEHEFGATFYIDDVTEPPASAKLDRSSWLSWEKVRKLSELGFEIGNATPHSRHYFFHNSKEKPLQRVENLERLFRENGLPQPTTFSYPRGSIFGPAVQILADKGYGFAIDYVSSLIYDPAQDHPLLLPGVGFHGGGQERERFRELLETRQPGRIPLLVFNGVETSPHGTSREQFREYVKYLADHKFTVIPIRDLARYGGADLRAVRLWRRDSRESLAATQSPRAPEAISPLQRQLETLILPQVNWQDASLDAVLKALRQQVAARSGEKLQPGVAPAVGLDLTTAVTLRLTGAPIMEILRYLGDLSHTDFAVDQYAISAKPRTGPGTRVTAKTPATPQQLAALDTLILPEINFHAATLPAILSALRAKADAASAGRIVPDFVTLPGTDLTTTATLRLTSTPFTEVLRYVGDLTGTDFTPERYAISVGPRAGTQPRITPKTPADPQLLQLLQFVTIPTIEFKDATLVTALDALRRKAGVASGGRLQPSFVLDPALDASAPVTLSLTAIPFIEAVRYCSDQVGAEFVVEKHAITLKRRTVPGKAPAREPFALVK